MKRIVTAALALVCITSGCAFTPQAIVVQPLVQVAPSDVGGGRALYVNVVDERPSKALGVRGAQKVGAELTIQGELSDQIAQTLRTELQKQKFAPAAAPTTDARELRVEIRNLSYDVIVGLWQGTIRVECGLKAICQLGMTRPYEQFYRGTLEEGSQFVKSDATNNVYVNRVISSAISQMLEDHQLLQCLAQ